jgi:hypothetical protein
MIQRLLYFLYLLLLPCCVFSQTYSYTRYDIQHGLAGSTVYCMLQDKQGFLWFGTETGVSRFDGTHFKNFTTFDGLPDNQVLEMFEDSKGRIWMAPFSKSVCYYYKGVIYNRDTDSVLKRIQPSGHVISFAEDPNGDIYILQDHRLHLLKANGRIHTFNSPNTAFLTVGRGPDKYIYVVLGNKVYQMQNDQLVFRFNIKLSSPNNRYVAVRNGAFVWRSGHTAFQAMNAKGRMEISYYTEAGPLKLSVINDSMVSVNLQTGAVVQNLGSGKFETFMPGEPVSAVYEDNERNLWFCTLGHGVFMLNSAFIFNLPLKARRGPLLSAYAIIKYKNEWLVGSDMATVYGVSQNKSGLVYQFRDSLPERTTDIYVNKNGDVWIGTDSRILRLGADLKQTTKIDNISVKGFFIRGDSMLVAGSRNVLVIDMKKQLITDTIWRERSTTVYQQHDNIFIGTLNGLFVLNNGRYNNIGDSVAALHYRITDIEEDKSGVLWIATFSGIYSFKNGRIISRITEDEGLVSNICRVLYIFNDELWAGTNKGLQKINIKDPLHPRPEYSLYNELSSGIINSVHADSTWVAVATPEGVNIFDKQKISFYSRCDLYIDNIIVTNRTMKWGGDPINLSHRDNNIRFEFAGISYRSAGDMRYQYRLVGLDNTWKQTRENYLSYPTLPGGDYQLEIQAINKFGVKSNLVTVFFNIEKRLWQKPWFQLLMALVVAVAIWQILNWRVRVIRRQENEKNNVRKKMAALEQLALKSQMNPHFIFNSLNSIQQYVLDKDVAGANKFITGFSRLIRQTLDISTRHEITLTEEIRYLSTYLELEKMRFEDKFVYEVVADGSLNPDECFIPPMILQPFVENCVRHGIRYRKDDKGRISVKFNRSGSSLDCVIEDNGVGRKTAGVHKSANPIEYQSKGISLTSDRIALLNRNAGQPIRINIYDLENDTGQGEGTRVILSFPLQSIEKL